MGFSQSSEVTLAKAAGSSSGLGKIGTVPVAGVLYVRLNCDKNVEKVDWQVLCDKAHAVQLYRARSIVQSTTLTLGSLAHTETFIMNGLTYTGHTDTTTVATRTFSISGDDTADAVALAGVINNPASGTLGLTATSALGVVTVVPSAVGGATLIQAVTGTAAGHCVVATTTLTGLVRHGSATSGVLADTTSGGAFYEQWIDGWPYAYLSVTNNDAAAATPVVKATRYWS